MFNANAIPQALIQDLLLGLESEDGSVADQMCRKVPVPSLEGNIPVLPSTVTAPRGDSDTGIPEGAQMDVVDDDYSTVAYACQRYAQAGMVRRGILESLNRTTGVDHLGTVATQLRREVHRKINILLETTLDSTTENLEANVVGGTGYSGAAWDDGGSASEPLKDIDLALETVPGADTMFIGRKVARALRSHPDLKAEFSNYSAGFLGDAQLPNVLRNKFGGLDIVIGNQFFGNDAAEGQTFSSGFDLADTVWLGYGQDLIMCEQEGASPHADQDKDVGRDGIILTFTRRIDIVRGHQETGITFTNVLS